MKTKTTMATERKKEPKMKGGSFDDRFRAILIGSRGRINGKVFSNRTLREILRRHLHLYEASPSDAGKTEVLLEIVNGRYRFYEKRAENQHVSMHESVTLDALLRERQIARLADDDESKKRIVRYLKGIMRQINAEGSNRGAQEKMAERASKRLKSVEPHCRNDTDMKDSRGQLLGCSLPPGTVFVSDCDGDKVHTPASADGWPGVEFGLFHPTSVKILEKAKRSQYPQTVKNTRGLKYDNCGQSPGLVHIFPNTNSKETAKMAMDLETDILLQLEDLGYDITQRSFYASRLGSSNKGVLQKAHVDLEEPEKFLTMKKAKLPVACLFPTSAQGCYLQVWPSGSGYGKIIRLELGEIMFFSPCLVHAGGLGEGCPRVQAYITDEERIDSFTHTTQYMRTKDMSYSDFCLSCVEKVNL
jgi:hypothetical protein